MSKVKISELPASQAIKASSGGIIVTAGKATIDNIEIDGNSIVATSGDLDITPATGSKIVLDGTINIDAGVVTGATSITSTAFAGALTGNVTGNVTGNASGTAATVTTAAQPAITSLGTLTVLQVDNINVNGNIISATTGAVNITPEAGSAIVLDGTISVDAGVVTGATSITSTVFAGALTGDVTGNVSGTSGSATGNAATATALQTARNIGGVSFNGTAAIIPTTIESANEATDTTCFPLFITGSGTQQLQPKNNTGLTYNSNTNALAATTFVGALTGNASTSTSATSATTAGTVTTAAQPAITSVGTLTDLTVAVGTGGTTVKKSGSFISNNAAVSNIGAGEDTLMTDNMAASTLINSGQFIEWEVSGINANNANTKTVKVYFGSALLLTIALPVSTAGGWWEAKVTVWRTGASTQKWTCQAKRIATGGGSIGANTAGTSTEDETAIIVFKTTGEAVADADITQQKSVAKSFGG